MFQLSIGTVKIGDLMSLEDGSNWINILCKLFPNEVIWLKRIDAQYEVIPVFTVSNDQPALVYVGKEA